MKKGLFFIYGLICYLVFQAAFVWGIAFTADVVPEALQAPGVPPVLALVIDLVLLSLFGMQHSIMARAGFKRWWTQIVPPPIERSTYVVLASLTLLLLFWHWRPLPGLVWVVEHPAGQALIWGLFGLGWLFVVVSTFLIDHLALTGLRQMWDYLQRTPPSPTPFKTPALYRLVRHPMMLGFLITFWATPHMTTGHLLFAFGMTAYILIGVSLEERDLLQVFGATYRAYQQRVPKVIPLLRWRGTAGPHPHTQADKSARS